MTETKREKREPVSHVVPIAEVNTLVGRVLKAADGLVYTVTSASTNWHVSVYDPRTHTFIFFDTKETFENWVYGAPVPSGAGRDQH